MTGVTSKFAVARNGSQDWERNTPIELLIEQSWEQLEINIEFAIGTRADWPVARIKHLLLFELW